MTGRHVDASAGPQQHGEGWRLSGTPPLVRLALAVLGGLLVVAAVLTLPTYPGLALLLGAVGLCTVLLSWIEPNRHRTPPRTVQRGDAVGLLVPVRTLPPAAITALGALAAAFVVYGLVTGASSVRQGDWWQALLGLAPVVIGVLLGMVPVAVLRTRRRSPHPGLLLTRDALHLPGPGTPVVTWEQVAGTGAGWVSRPAQDRAGGSRVSNLLSLRLTPAAAELHVADPYVADTGAFHLSVETLASDPHAVRALLDHYLASPQDREELGTDAAVRRFEALSSTRADG